MNENRYLKSVISSRLAEKAPLIQVVIGPRQIGKTTALKASLKADAIYESADSPTPMNATVIEEWWEKANKTKSKILAIDEIQKIFNWSEVLKKLWDRDKYQLKVIVTGSSALLMEKGLKETLAGRFELIRAEHWNYQEANKVFDMSLKDYVEYGCYPGSMKFISDVERWGSYVRDSIIEPAIGRDLLQLHPVDQPALLRQVFRVAVGHPSEIISLTKLQGQLEGKGSVVTLQHYLKLLEDAFLVTGIQKYSTKILRTKKTPPKIIVHDNALMRCFERPITERISSEKFGRYFENTIGARLIEAGWELYYWKDRDKEVDFVALGPGGEKYAIEVKSAKTKISDLKSLIDFCKTTPSFEPCLISMDNQKIDGIKTLDVEQVLFCHRKY
ncbi:MAG: ATP-binding protein [Bdellovibrionota bacterium]